MAGLFGAMSRLMGQSPPSYRKCDDVAAGLVIKHRMSPAYQRQLASDAVLAQLLVAGMSPDDIKEFLG